MRYKNRIFPERCLIFADGFVFVVAHHFHRQVAGVRADFVFDLVGNFRMVAQEYLGVFPPLAEFFALIGEPCAGFFDQTGFDAEVDQLAGFGNAFPCLLYTSPSPRD